MDAYDDKVASNRELWDVGTSGTDILKRRKEIMDPNSNFHYDILNAKSFGEAMYAAENREYKLAMMSENERKKLGKIPTT